MARRKLKPIEERDPFAACCMDAFDRLENGLPLLGELFDAWYVSTGHWIYASRDDAFAQWREHGIDGLPKYVSAI